MPAARPDPTPTGEAKVVRLPGPFESFYVQEYRRVVKLAYALSGSRMAAEDIAQEAFLAAYRDWDRVGGYEQRAAWVRQVAANLAMSSLRRRFAEVRALARLAGRREVRLDAMPAGTADFWRTVRALPKRQAQAVALHYLEDLSIQQIAEVLDCAEGTVKAHQAKGRRTARPIPHRRAKPRHQMPPLGDLLVAEPSPTRASTSHSRWVSTSSKTDSHPTRCRVKRRRGSGPWPRAAPESSKVEPLPMRRAVNHPKLSSRQPSACVQVSQWRPSKALIARCNSAREPHRSLERVRTQRAHLLPDHRRCGRHRVIDTVLGAFYLPSDGAPWG
jgi:RNA polymerase sigma factor (sigma-70 family)